MAGQADRSGRTGAAVVCGRPRRRLADRDGAARLRRERRPAMNPHFQLALQALQRASEHMIAASNAMQDSHAAMTEAIREVLNANGEHNDLRETVERLETTVLAQTAEIQALRAEVAALRKRRREGR